MIKLLKKQSFLSLSNETKAGMLNLLVNKKILHCYKDISFANHARLNLDVYAPVNINKELPVLVFVHGGSWNSGSKDDYLFMAESFCTAGLVCVVVNYRLAPSTKFPDYVLDTSKAIQWVQENITNYGGNNKQIFVMGHSAGAFNVVSAINDKNILAQTQLDLSSIKAVIGVSGPYAYDFRKDKTREAFKKSAQPLEVMPIHHIISNPIPHLLLIADKDGLVEDFNTFDLKLALEEKGGEVELKRVHMTNHISIIAACALKLRFLGATRKQVLAYIKKMT